MSVGISAKTGFFAVCLLLAVASSFYAVSGVRAPPKVEWTQVSDSSTGRDAAWGVAVDASGIYVVGFDSSTVIINIQWWIEKISADVATPFYMQIWFIIVSTAVSAVITLFAAVIIMHRKKRKAGIV